jgi:AcrR family transcriptional regulator
MSSASPSLRERRRADTQRAIQAHALRLFTENGYDSTTMHEIAAATGVSPMTLYRHFPTKEDLVLIDQHNQIIAERIAAGSADDSLVHRIGRALVETAHIVTGSDDAKDGASKQLLLARLRLMISTPALRARHLDSQYATQQAIVGAVLGDETDPEAEFRAWVAAGACLAALNVATMRWADEDGRSNLPALIASALAAAFDGTASRQR